MVDKKTGLKPKASTAKPSTKSLKTDFSAKAKTQKAKKDVTVPKVTKVTSKKDAAGVKADRADVIAEVAAKILEQPKEEHLTKAGKHSAKALREAEELAAKEARKKDMATAEEKPKTPKKPTRPRSERAGKKYREAYKLVDKTKTYSLAEALDLATKTSPTKFDSSVELHINLGVDPKQADHNIRGMVSLPAGTGKKIKVAVFAEGDDANTAKSAGADLVGSEELLATLDKEEIKFDVLITTPSLMPKLGKYARLLGPKGLMPNPKSGTITKDIANAVAAAKAGQVEYRLDPAGIIHLPIGKVSFGPEKLSQNAQVVLDSIKAAKPASLKGVYIKSIYVTTTMGPSIRLSLEL